MPLGKKALKPLIVSVNELYSHFKNELSKSLVTRVLKKYIRQENYQKAVFEGRYLGFGEQWNSQPI